MQRTSKSPLHLSDSLTWATFDRREYPLTISTQYRGRHATESLMRSQPIFSLSLQLESQETIEKSSNDQLVATFAFTNR